MDNIIFMQPVYKDYIWGGKKLKEKFNKNTPYKKTAESWEISSNKNGDCKIINQEFKGKTLSDLFALKKLKKNIFGLNCENMDKFPLLIKFIDAKNDLSVQVHPDDKYAKKIGESNGKNEMWYIIDCKKDAQIIGGLNKKTENNEIEDIIRGERLKEFLNYINVKKGDSIYIEAGTLHAILKNNLICEIQQNCDITYRVYDWDRIDKYGNSRKLDIQNAINTIKTNNYPIIKHTNNKMVENLTTNKFFVVDKIKCNDKYIDVSNEKTFYAINIVNGCGTITTKRNKKNIKQGDSFLIPATLGEYTINGNIEFLKTYIN